MKRIATLMIGLVLAVASLAQPAAAQDDNAYVFGTTLVMTSPRQVADPNKGWWGDMLPMEYRFSIGSIVAAINAARAARGETVMVDVTTYPINVGGEFVVDSGYEYTIDFQKMRPADVEVALEKFPMTGIFSDLQTTLRPVRIGYFWGNNPDGGAVAIALPTGDFTISPDEGFGTVQARLAELFAAQFSGRAKFDLGMNRYSSALGSESFDVNITVYLDGAETSMGYPQPYEGEYAH